MKLAPGKRLGPYEIVAPLGAGGMGQVWKARDTRLGRDVAIKVLPDDVATDSRALARFETEARAVAALSHPNILSIYDVGEEDSVCFVVTEFLEGETLRTVIGRGPLPVRRALEIGIEITEALSAAHGKGIVHRDVKPENVFLTLDGHVKLLDFGLARKVPTRGTPEDGQSPTVELLTEPGVMVGTVAYVSPEQARGTPVDFRSDQFSFGILLYEILAGQRPFHGETAAETITAILREEPEPLGKAIPPPVRWIVERCLAKEPPGRYASTSDLARDLTTCRQHISELTSRTAMAGTEPAGTASRPFVRGLLAVAAALALLASGVLLDRLVLRKARPAPTPELVRLTWEPGYKRFSSISPDGNSFVYESGLRGKTDLFLRRVGGDNPVNLTKDCPEEDTMPAYSPDGQTIAFRSGRQGGGIFLMGATGESVRRLSDFGFEPAWSPDGKSIAVATGRADGVGLRKEGLWILDVASGGKRKLFDGDAVHPSWSPDGSRVAFHWRKGSRGGTALATIAVSGGAPVPVVELESSLSTVPEWTRDWIWFASTVGGGQNLWRVHVDQKTGACLGLPERVTASTLRTWFPSATPDGRRVIFPSFQVLWTLFVYTFDVERGKVLPESRVVSRGPRDLRVRWPSPDGEWLATLLFEREIQDLVLVRSSTGEMRRLTDDSLREDMFAWSPDGTKVYFSMASGGPREIWSIGVDGSGRVREVAAPGKEDLMGPLPSPEGRSLFVPLGLEEVPALVNLGLPPGQRRPEPLPPMDGKLTFQGRGWSPDGKGILGYPRDETGEAVPELTFFDVEQKTYRKVASLDAVNDCAFLPDGRRILLWRKGVFEVLDRETGTLTPAGSVPEEYGLLQLSLDGRTLSCFMPTVEGDIWMLDYGSSSR